MFNFLKKKRPGETKAEQIKELSEFPLMHSAINGLDCDEMPNAYGEFGRAISNPIPVNGPIGEIKYLKRLRLQGNPTMFHRLTSTRYETYVDQGVDIYELCDFSGEHWDLLYLHMYHPRRSEKIPSGYTQAEFHPVLSSITPGMGINDFVKTFPYFLGDVLDKKYGEMFGLGRLYGELFQNDKQYYRPIDHFIKLLHVNSVGNFFTNLNKFVAHRYPNSYFIHLLRNTDLHANIAALKAIVEKGEEANECMGAVIELDTKVTDEDVSELIGDAIKAMFPEITSVIPTFIDGLFEEPDNTQVGDVSKFDLAVKCLQMTGYCALPYLKPLMFHESARIRKLAKDLITEIHNKTIYNI